MNDKRTNQRRNNERRSDRLHEAVSGLSPDEIKFALKISDSRIEIRCPSPLKSEIEATAGRFGLTVTTYLLRLHELAREKLKRCED
jgi:hypothetical protein